MVEAPDEPAAVLGFTFSDIYCEWLVTEQHSPGGRAGSRCRLLHADRLLLAGRFASRLGCDCCVSPCTPADYINISYWSCLLVSVLTGNELFNQLAHFELYTAGGHAFLPWDSVCHCLVLNRPPPLPAGEACKQSSGSSILPACARPLVQ